MSSDAPFTPRKKHNVLWWVVGFFALLLVLFFVQLFGPSPRIVVSPQTTHIVNPLGPDGLPDYEQYLLEMSREGVTSENNAAPLIWKALFPGELAPEQFGALATELGLEQIPSKEESLVPLHHNSNRQAVVALLRQRVEPNGAGASKLETPADPPAPDELMAATSQDDWFAPHSTAVENVLDQLIRQPWTSEDLPPLGRWVRENQQPLDLLVEASRRPRFYFPSTTLLDKDRDLLIEMLLPHAQSVREAGRSLPARAMWHLGEGRPEEAWQDLLALHRLANLLTQSYTLVEQLVAMAMSGIACEGTLTLLDHGRLTPDLARQVQRDLAALPNFASVARSLDDGERTWALDACVRIGSGGGRDLFAALGGGGEDIGNSAFDVVSVDWNLVLRQMNRWYDRLVAAASMPNQQDRAAALDKIEADIQAIAAQAHTPTRMLAGVVSRRQRSELVTDIMLSMFLPALRAATNAEDRVNATLELTRLAAALAVFRVEQGEYPEQLQQLVPAVLDTLPADLYNAKPFVYKRHSTGFLLYSLGENGVDDGGSNAQMQIIAGQDLDELDATKREQLESAIPAKADDISIRSRPRAFEWPNMMQPTEP